jgi:hypothetical protein
MAVRRLGPAMAGAHKTIRAVVIRTAPRRAAPSRARLVAPYRARDRPVARPAALFRDLAAGPSRARRVPFPARPAACPRRRRPRRRRPRLLPRRPAGPYRASRLRLPVSPRPARRCLRSRPCPRPTRVVPPRRRRRPAAGPRHPSTAVPLPAPVRPLRVRGRVPAVPRAARRVRAARVRALPARARARPRPGSADRAPVRVLAITPSARRRPVWAPPRPGPSVQSAVTVRTAAIGPTGATGVRVPVATGSGVRVPAVPVIALRVPALPVRAVRAPVPRRARVARVRVARAPRRAARVLAR